MTITPELKRALAEANGAPVRLEDPETNESYLLKKEAQPEHLPPVSEGIRLAGEAFRRDLPAMMADKKLNKKWVLYHRDQRIAVGKRAHELGKKALALGIARGDFWVFYVEPEETDFYISSFGP